MEITLKELSRSTNIYGVTMVKDLVKSVHYGESKYMVKTTTIQPDGTPSTAWGKSYKNKKAFCKWYNLPLDIFEEE